MSVTTLAPAAEPPFNASAVLEATRGVLRGDWMTYPAYHGMTGTLRSHRGHNIHFQGIQDNHVFAVAQLDNGTRREVSAPATAHTAAAYGKALADLVRDELEPAHDATSRTRIIHRKVRAVAPPEARTVWHRGEAVTSWRMPEYGSARHATRITRDDYLDDTPDYAASHVQFSHLTVEQAATILRAIRTDNRDPRRKEPVFGPLAEQMRAAAPGLRPGDTYKRHGHGPTTVTLFVDGTVDVQLRLLRESAPVTLTVYGSMDNQLRAVAASV